MILVRSTQLCQEWLGLNRRLQAQKYADIPPPPFDVQLTNTPLCHRPSETPTGKINLKIRPRSLPLKFRPHWEKWKIIIPTVKF